MAVLEGSRVRSLMFFADDPRAVAEWWAAVLGVQQVNVEEHAQGPFAYIETNGFELGIHVADPAKNPLGGSPVVYWSVASVRRARRRLLGMGAAAHRGPIQVNADRSICQLTDPFGNIFGLDGPP